MQASKTRRNLFIFIAVSVLLLAAWYAVSYFLSLRTLVVEYRNVEYAAIFDSKKLNNGENPKPIKENIVSGQEIKLQKGLYTIRYEGSEGYEDRFIEFELVDNGQVFAIDPEYSEERLEAETGKEIPAIQKVLEEKYRQISLYKINRGKLYVRGEWYGTTLIYKGEYSSSSDTLRVVLYKENGNWVVKTDPPGIVFYKNDYPNIPESVLRDVNALPVPETELE